MTRRSTIAYMAAALIVACAGCPSAKPEAPSASDLKQLTGQAVNAASEPEGRAAVDQLREVTFQRSGVEIRQDRPVRTLPMDAAISEALRRVLVEGQHPSVRAQAAKTLGEMMDVDSAEPLLDAMEDDSVEVRREAYNAMNRILGVRFRGLDPEDPPELRAEAAKRSREFFETMKLNQPMIEVIRDPRKRAAYDKQVIQRYRQLINQQEADSQIPYADQNPN